MGLVPAGQEDLPNGAHRGDLGVCAGPYLGVALRSRTVRADLGVWAGPYLGVAIRPRTFSECTRC